jgi:hypothetical protein
MIRIFVGSAALVLALSLTSACTLHNAMRQQQLRDEVDTYYRQCRDTATEDACAKYVVAKDRLKLEMQTQPQNVGLLGLPTGPVYRDPVIPAAPLPQTFNCTTTPSGFGTQTRCN